MPSDPPSPDHFARWLAIPPRSAKVAFEALGDELEPVERGRRARLRGDRRHRGPFETARGRPPPPLLRRRTWSPGSLARRLFPGAAATRALTPTGQAGNYPVLLVDGVVGGVWHQRRAGRRIEITVEPLRALTAPQRRDLEADAALVGRVLEAEPVLAIGPVTVGAHA